MDPSCSQLSEPLNLKKSRTILSNVGSGRLSFKTELLRTEVKDDYDIVDRAILFEEEAKTRIYTARRKLALIFSGSSYTVDTNRLETDQKQAEAEIVQLEAELFRCQADVYHAKAIVTQMEADVLLHAGAKFLFDAVTTPLKTDALGYLHEAIRCENDAAFNETESGVLASQRKFYSERESERLAEVARLKAELVV